MRLLAAAGGGHLPKGTVTLEQLVADLSLDKAMLHDVSQKSFSIGYDAESCTQLQHTA